MKYGVCKMLFLVGIGTHCHDLSCRNDIVIYHDLTSRKRYKCNLLVFLFGGIKEINVVFVFLKFVPQLPVSQLGAVVIVIVW